MKLGHVLKLLAEYISLLLIGSGEIPYKAC